MTTNSKLMNFQDGFKIKLEIPAYDNQLLLFIIIQAIIQLAYGFYSYTHTPHAEDFLYLLVVPVIFFLLKSPLTFLSFIITGVIMLSFLALGAIEDVTKGAIMLSLTVFIFIYPNYGLILGVSSLYLFVIPSYQGFTLTHLVFLTLGISYCLLKLSTRDFPIYRMTGFTRVLSLFYIWCVFTFLWCKNLSYGLYDLFEILVLFQIFLLCVSLIEDEEQLLKICWTFVIMAFFYSMAKPFLTSPLESASTAGAMSGGTGAATGIAMGLFSAKNSISSLINLSIFVLIALFYLNKNLFSRLFLIMSFCGMILVNILFGSKGGLVSLGFGIIIYFFLVNTKKKRWKKAALTVITVCTIAALIIVIPLIPLLMFPMSQIISFELFATMTGSASLDFRFDQWAYAAEMLADYGNQLTGLGISGYKSLFLEYNEREFNYNPMIYAHPHSYWVYTYADFGIIGSVLLNLFFILFIIRMYKFLKKTNNKTLQVVGSAIFAGIISYWVHGMVDFGYNEANRLWLFIGTGTALTFFDEKKSNKDTSVDEDTL